MTNSPAKFDSSSTLPTAYEREVLTIFIEEASEVIQRATKLLRFGGAEVQTGQPYSNIERLSHEVGNFLEMVDVVGHAGLFNYREIDRGKLWKQGKLEHYMRTESERERS